jgi:amino acid adenylation domain-containing protein
VLAEPDRGATGSTAGFVPPRTAEEQTLARILAGVLGIDEVGVQDNFFTLGGDSIRALQVRVLAREGGLDLSIDDLLRFQTVAGLARAARPTASPATATRLAGGPFALLGDADRARLPAGVVDAYPLTRLQAGLVFHSEGSPDYETYVMDFHVGGSFAEPALREALARLVRRHPLLRTSFDLTGFSESVQLVHETATVPLTVHDLTGGSAAEQDAAVDRLMREQRWLKFDWTRAPLLRVDVLVGSDRSFHCTFSHPFFDGWSMALLVTELLTTYTALAHGEDPATAPPPLNYAEFVALEREAVGSAEQRQFWADYLAGGSGGRLPRSPSQRRVAPSRHRRLTVQIDSGIRDGLRSLAASVGSPLKSVLLAAHLRVVSVLTGRTDVTTGVIANGRPEELDGDRTIGVFLNTVPLRTRLTGGTWRDLVRQALAAEREVLPYRRYPLAELVRTVGHGEQLFDTAFNYIHFHLYEVLRHTPGLELLGWRNPADQTYFPLTAYLHLDVSTGELQCFIDVDEAVLTPAQVAAVLAYYRATLEDMATNPDGRYEAHSPLQPAQRRQLAEWNRTGLAWPADRPAGVHRRVALQASRRGAATAVHCAGVRLSYVELERRANQLAHRLRRMGAGAGTTVGVALDRSADLPVAILAVLKTGAAYVPLDPAYPGERLRHMLLDSGARIVVTESSLVDRVPSTGAHPLLLDRERPALAAQPASAPEVTFDPEALAYVIYTSGSTGVPKGVEVPHRALDNVLLAFEDRLGWSADEALLAVTTLSFDIAGLELLLPLTTGARLELATRAEAADPHLLMARLDTGAVSTMQATPATWRMLLDAGWSGHPALRLLCGGEALTASLAERLLPCCRELWNVYGPTETTIWSTAARVEEVNGAPPIGRPLANTTCHVLDGYGQPVPVGAPGELYLGGLGLARGYRGDPALTRAVFVCDPFRTGDRTARLYGTGDLVRWRPDGMLEFLGRLDSQVKVRGFRIELGEVEAALARHPEIRDSAARARTDDESGEAELIAYVVPRPGCEVNVAELRGALAGDLPSFMVPSTFVVLDELPRTANGKLDRGALPAPPTRRPNLATAFAGPRTELERRVAGIWQEFLGVGRVGIDDRFFELGGHSLLLVRVHARMRELIAADVPLTALLAHPTVRSVAAFLEEPDRGTRPAVPAQPEIRDRQALVSRLRTRRPRSAE